MKMVSLAKFQIGKKSPEYSRKSVQNIQGGKKKKKKVICLKHKIFDFVPVTY